MRDYLIEVPALGDIAKASDLHRGEWEALSRAIATVHMHGGEILEQRIEDTDNRAHRRVRSLVEDYVHGVLYSSLKADFLVEANTIPDPTNPYSLRRWKVVVRYLGGGNQEPPAHKPTLSEKT